jgi:hypothetical protein
MKKLESFFNLLEVLGYGKSSAKTADQLSKYFEYKSLSDFKRKLRIISQEARLKGHWVIGDDSGYYLALTKEEWQSYRNKRFHAINTELQALASCDKISFSDLIKNIYAVSPTDKNFSLF